MNIDYLIIPLGTNDICNYNEKFQKLINHRNDYFKKNTILTPK